jgi:signal transduction histidine kinase
VSRIRDFSKKAPVRRQSLEVNEAILEIMRLTRSAMSDNGVLVKKQLSESLPRILGDKVQLQQVILNLIMNAIEAMGEVSEGPRELLISTSNAESGSVLVAVGDSGPGLPGASPERLFDAFYTTKASGLGIGLSICRSIVEAHGGRLWATPNEPRGAVFYMMLPIEEKSLEELDSSAAKSCWKANGTGCSPHRFIRRMIVFSNPRWLKQILTSPLAWTSIITLRSGAFERFRLAPPDRSVSSA